MYLKYLRNIAERTDIGRLAGPSLLRLVDEAMNLSSRGSNLNGKMSAEMWDILERALEVVVTPISFIIFLGLMQAQLVFSIGYLFAERIFCIRRTS